MKVLKNEIRDLVSQKVLVSIFYIGIIFLDALGSVFPNYLNRQVTLFMPLPLVFIIHVLNAKKKSKLFLLSLVFHFLGLYYFNNPYKAYNGWGIVFHGIAFFLYFLILYRHFQIVSTKRVLKFSFLIMILVGIPTAIYFEGMKKAFLLQETMLYVCCVTLFIFSASILYMENKTKTNRFLLFAAVSILISAYLQGYHLFMGKSDFLVFSSIIFFNLTHYFMCWYLIEKSKQKSALV
ncbi:hypothetical protein C1H87_14450 [Flavivirga eckloniae]|uniref:Lysoplasmalogenase n=1 Tax=Flavivirga eckloniae TaxID=1803846 RepID=A0A2K9PSQ0_9FLAO|nr:hypothetical protein C1H87_14450 [Flavivirga eckloniae]